MMLIGLEGLFLSIRTLACLMSFLPTLKAKSLFHVALLVFVAVGMGYPSEYWGVDIHWDCLIIRVVFGHIGMSIASLYCTG